MVVETEEQRKIDRARASGYSAACDNLCNWLNTIDTEGMTVLDLKSKVYQWGMDNG